LETVNSLIGANSPHKFKRILDLPVYGVDAIDVSNELSERGLQAVVNGEFLILPGVIRPYPGDFFVFAYEGLETHLFRVNDVQYDKLTAKKYYRCQYSLYNQNADEIFDNVIADYEAVYDDSGNGSLQIKASEDAASDADAKELTDSLIDKFSSLFYDDDSDTFTFKNGNEQYWSPYLQHFLYETQCFSPYKGEIMTEIYINDINEREYPNIYSEEAFRHSLYYILMSGKGELSFD